MVGLELQYVVQFEPSHTVREGEQGSGQGELQYAAYDFVQRVKNKVKMPAI